MRYPLLLLLPLQVAVPVLLFRPPVVVSAFFPPRPPMTPRLCGTSPIARRSSSSVSAPARAASALSSTTDPAAPDRYCERCGSPTRLLIPPGDERERAVCASPECGHVTYDNPKVVAGAVCTHGGRVLLCRRAIEPCVGLWGYPQGFLELGETTREGAARETFEEAGATIPDRGGGMDLMAVYNIGGSQVQMVYRVEMDDDVIKAGTESLEARWFAWDEVPWDDLAFPTVGWSLRHAMEGGGGLLERTKMIGADGTWSVREG